jgi:hypothetical protein
MTVMPIDTCPPCGLPFRGRPILEQHFREDHPQMPEHGADLPPVPAGQVATRPADRPESPAGVG